ncbi:hypothetical protein Pa4123_06810 [Phytohabitans aurantiacus]|uniref:VWFD domain-containing protein n=1 Tax=Phytohabitans aurantiacus TaxID=3016789 RepID=A0ABQ5QM25_9ACTN|nr:hypothetical protein Pa4123_06810 [Phytohabitans aurantiacus]
MLLRAVLAVIAAAVVAVASALVAPARPAAAASPFAPMCIPYGKPYLANTWTSHSPRGPKFTLVGKPDQPETTETFEFSGTIEAEVSLSAAFGIEADAIIATASAEFGVQASVRASVTVSVSKTITVPRNKTYNLQYGFWVGYLKYRQNWLPAGCNESLEFLPGWQSEKTVRVVLGHGWNLEGWPGAQGRPAPPNPGAVDPPSPGPQPVTSVYGLADGTVLHTTDTRRVYKMVGGAPVWQATCDGGICQPASRPTTQAVIDAGPDVPRNGSSALDQRGRVYIFVGGAPLWQSHCAAPVNCGTPVRISDWSIDAHDHMNAEPVDRQLIQGWTGGSATPVAQTVGGARVNFGSEQEVLDTGFGASWRNQVVILSTGSFNTLGEVPRDGTLLQGAGGTSTPVAMFAGGARINFASPQEVVETGYGNDWASKVRAIPKRAFDAMRADVPPDGTLIQGIANGVPTPVAQLVGGSRINYASPEEVIATGYGTEWRRHVRTIPTRAFNLITDRPPSDGTLIQGAGGAPTPVAQMLGGGRMNFANEQEVIAAGNGSDWRQKVRAIPVRAYNAIYEGIGHGTRIKKAGAADEAAMVGGAKLPFTNLAQLQASSYAPLPSWLVPARIWDALPTKVPDGITMKAAETGTLYRVRDGETDLVGQCPNEDGCDAVAVLPQSMIDPIAHGVSNRGPAYGALARYYDGKVHYTTTGVVPAGQRIEYVFGLLAQSAESGTVRLSACSVGTDYFTSTRDDCEGQTVLDRLGWIYTSPPADKPSRPVYRCQVTATNLHFDSLSETCEGQRTEFRLGYVIAYGQLTRYIKGGELRTALVGVPAGYQAQETLGMLPQVEQPGTVPLYACEITGEGFTSTSATCEGQRKLAQLGYIYTAPPQGLPSAAMYRCLARAGTEHFDTLDSTCGEYETEQLIGYVVAVRTLNRAMRGSDHRTATGTVPAGYRHEWTWGYLDATPRTGTRALYSCQAGSDAFTSTDAACEGYQKVQLLGWISEQRPSGVPSVPFYRCIVNDTTRDHFDSISDTCEGHTKEFLLGYVRTLP